jgi:ParB family chromosome partitioning protein
VRQTEAIVREQQRHGPRTIGPRDPDTVALERDLSMRLGLPVRLQPRRTGGTLSIAYRSAEQLDDLINRLT